jgi:hypothetical protein
MILLYGGEIIRQFTLNSLKWHLTGALVARREQGKENKGRCILFVGDGSLHMTVQELSTIIRHNFHPTIILINNSGYTIERVIHGPTQKYNDISESWDYQNMLNFFGARSNSASSPNSYTARTYSDLGTILSNPSFIKNSSIQLLEAFMDKFDSPWMLTRQINIVQERFGKMQAAEDARKGRKRKCLDTNLYKSKYNNTGLESTRYVMHIEGGGENAIKEKNDRKTRTEKVAWRTADLISEKNSIAVRVNGYEQWGI